LNFTIKFEYKTHLYYLIRKLLNEILECIQFEKDLELQNDLGALIYRSFTMICLKLIKLDELKI